MLSNHKIQSTLEEMKDISRVDMCLYNEKGKLVASTYELEENLEEAVMNFVDSMAESQMLSGYHFFKVIVEDVINYVLLVRSQGEEAYMVGRLAVCQIRNLTEAYREQFDRNNFMQNVLLGNMLLVDMYNKAKKFHIDQVERVVYVVEVEEKRDTSVMEIVRSMFGGGTKDYVVELEEQSVILIKDVQDVRQETDLENIAKTLVDTLQGELMIRVRVGYGNRVLNLPDLAKSYQEAKMAIEVGKIFYAEKDTISYSNLGIGRLIYQLPMTLCEMFIKEVFGAEIPDVFQEENVVTIQKFFENNLNISETSRQLYVHRNTLVYRLERLEKMIGLDIRKFDDAMTFKIAMMVLSHMAYQKGKSLLDQNEE